MSDFESIVRSLETELDKLQSVRNYDKESKIEEVDFWERQCHEMQKGVSEIYLKLPGLLRECAKLERELKYARDITVVYRQSADDLQANNDSLMTSKSELEKDKKALEQEIERIKAERLETKDDLLIEINERDEKICDLMQENSSLEKELTRISHNPHRKGRRGGSKLTDKQIERLLKIYAKSGKYRNMSLNQAIKSVAQTHRTYYRVIGRTYDTEATNERIERIASENGIILPRRVKTV